MNISKITIDMINHRIDAMEQLGSWGESISNGYVRILKDIKSNPNKAILYISNKNQDIRYIARCIIEGRTV